MSPYFIQICAFRLFTAFRTHDDESDAMIINLDIILTTVSTTETTSSDSYKAYSPFVNYSTIRKATLVASKKSAVLILRKVELRNLFENFIV
jgi:hypothetical protein